jgi:hypothetical protein
MCLDIGPWLIRRSSGFTDVRMTLEKAVVAAHTLVT